MQSLVVPKGRKPKFDVEFKILDLNNIPYVAGRIYVKWHLSGSHEHDHRTNKAPIRDHKAVFDYQKTTSVRLIVDKNNWLQESTFSLHVIHEVPTSGKEERSMLGTVKINLAEYVQASQTTHEPIARRFLLQESRINSTLKVAIQLIQTEGDRSYMAPQLKSAPQFIGIAGVIADQQAEQDNAGPTITVDNVGTETSEELRELYRKTLAAEFYCQTGEPCADQVIEDIFTGGDGWCGMREASSIPIRRRGAITSDDNNGWSDGETSISHNGKMMAWSGFLSSPRSKHQKKNSRDNISLKKHDYGLSARLRTRTDFDQVSSHRQDIDHEQAANVALELDELDEREDLSCWVARAIP